MVSETNEETNVTHKAPRIIRKNCLPFPFIDSNPKNPRRSDPGFILAYQRINVSLSRARRMLVMVGNRKYLEEKGVIDLPDVYGRVGKEQRNFRVYEEILSTIERYGKVIEDIDVLDDKEARING